MTNERDTQFAEFAKLLFEDLNAIHQGEWIYMDVEDEDSEEDISEYVTAISRRVYDLAQFIVSQAYADDLKPNEILYKDGKPVLMYPENLKEWYESKS